MVYSISTQIEYFVLRCVALCCRLSIVEFCSLNMENRNIFMWFISFHFCIPVVCHGIIRAKHFVIHFHRTSVYVFMFISLHKVHVRIREMSTNRMNEIKKEKKNNNLFVGNNSLTKNSHFSHTISNWVFAVNKNLYNDLRFFFLSLVFV